MNKDEMQKLIEKYITEARKRINSLPRSKGSGYFPEIMGALQDFKANSQKVEKIVNEENSNLIDYVNENYVKDWTDEETAQFLEEKREAFLILLQSYVKINALSQQPI